MSRARMPVRKSSNKTLHLLLIAPFLKGGGGAAFVWDASSVPCGVYFTWEGKTYCDGVSLGL